MEKYRIVKIERLFHGYATIRDYVIQEAKKNGMGLVIYCGNEYIYIPHSELDKSVKYDETYKSKHIKGQTYKLEDYDWRAFKHYKLPIQQQLL